MYTGNREILTPRQQLALRQESELIDRLSDGLEGALSENQYGAARIAVRRLFRAGVMSGSPEELPEPLSAAFEGERFEAVREILDSSDEVRCIAQTAFMHGVEVHG